MIKFFRRIRFKLLSTGNMGEYFKYAIGEIILVVIGILIALQINNWNQESKNQKKINSIFKEVLSDLHDDITEATRVIEFYEMKDSLTQYILSNKVTVEDYKIANPYLTLVLNQRSIKFNVNGYESLNLHIDKFLKGTKIW